MSEATAIKPTEGQSSAYKPLHRTCLSRFWNAVRGIENGELEALPGYWPGVIQDVYLPTLKEAEDYIIVVEAENQRLKEENKMLKAKSKRLADENDVLKAENERLAEEVDMLEYEVSRGR